MKIQFSVKLEFSVGKRRPKKDTTSEDSSRSSPTIETGVPIPGGLEFSGSTTEIRPQPTYVGFTVPEEEV